MTFYLNIVSIEKQLFSGLVKKINIKGSEGDLSIFSKHTPLLTTIKSGIINIITEYDKKKSIYLFNGILEVQFNIVTILTNVINKTYLDIKNNIN
ncbi:ATP synthase epsilon chain [Serratia symbiotica]|nr:ATP synthase epsilon chain [Serratia symbiotica]